MKFGVFDHMDESGVSLEQQFEERLKLIEAYAALLGTEADAVAA